MVTFLELNSIFFLCLTAIFVTCVSALPCSVPPFFSPHIFACFTIFLSIFSPSLTISLLPFSSFFHVLSHFPPVLLDFSIFSFPYVDICGRQRFSPLFPPSFPFLKAATQLAKNSQEGTKSRWTTASGQPAPPLDNF